MKTQEWYTPPEILKALGEFDLDPCFPVHPIYQTAKNTFNIHDNGLIKDWFGRVWLNPPYNNLFDWLNKMSKHKDGTVLIPARTDTAVFQEMVFERANSILFLKGRMTFYTPEGTKAKHNSGFSSVLIAYNESNSEKLLESGFEGKHICLQDKYFLIGFDKSWKMVIKSILTKEMSLNDIYKLVEKIAPEKILRNQHYKAKIRQQLQMHFTRTKESTYA